jgi:sulfoxide reductase heme-binding subunit YedZ
MVLTLTGRRWIVALASALPLLYIVQAIVRVQMGEWNLLGPEPGKAITLFTGTWGFNFLLMTLAVTPLSRYAGQRWLMAHRRMLGLYAAFYVSLHALAYLAFLLGWQWGELGREVVERPYLLVGALSWLLLLPLVVTSTRGWQRTLKKRWKRLHQLIYIVVVLAAVHYLLQIRASWLDPVAYTLIAAILLALRTRFFVNRKRV